jgi:dipeptidyl aminopeptidase/acylaminoacyl peptidase
MSGSVLVRTFSAALPWLSLFAAATSARSQAPAGGFLRPPEAIARLVEAPAAPETALSPQRRWLSLTTREPLPGLDVVARPYHKLAGLRIDPASHGPQLSTKVMALSLVDLSNDQERAIDVPLPGDWSGPIWSADDRAFALLRAANGGAELWVADPASAPPVRIDGVRANRVLGSGVQWLPDQRRLLVTAVVPGAPPPAPAVPSGPQLQDSVAGQKATVRTYQDLLQDAHDEALLQHFGQSQLVLVDAATRKIEAIGKPDLFDRVEPSPDGTLLLTSRVARPFSYLVPLGSFPSVTEVRTLAGAVVRTVVQQPLQEAVPIGGVATGPRGVDWVPVLPHTLVWIEAQDGGDPKRDVPHRDHVLRLAEPAVSEAQPALWFRTEHRAAGLAYGGDGAFVLANEFDRKQRRQRAWQFDAVDAARPGKLLYERSTQDAYGDPGRPVMERRADGRVLLRMRDQALFLSGDGASPSGNRPFVDRWVPGIEQKERLFHAAEGRHETFVGFLGDDEQRVLVRSESPTEPPSLVVVDLGRGSRTTLRSFPDAAAEATKGVQKRLLKYTRADGVPLSGTLYLPPTWREGDQVPCLIWAYPLEYSQASDAGQVRATPNRYLRLGGTSHLFLLLAGYAVLDDAAMPIVGPQRTANDTFVVQLQQNAQAAVDALAKEGCIDTARLSVAGHSYGAFMTANLLAHTDLFAAGIARSGAYNRTLTPFGFQNEERTYWEAPEIYQAMSPFAHAHRINEPILLIHGDDDNNPGTFPVQSQRLFAALKGHGGTARLCMLPHESHGYRARENVLHCLAEMIGWLDRHCGKRGK